MNWFTPRHYDSLHQLLTELTHKAADTDKLVANVDTAVTLLGSLSTDIAALKAQIAGITTDPAVQDSIDAIDAKITKASDTLTAGEAANPA